jgi:hypothetical protein
VIGLGILLIPAWVCYAAYLLHGLRPALFHPFARHPGALDVHLEPLLFLIFGAIIVILFLLFGLGLLGIAVFGGEFPPSRARRYRLPKELQQMGFPYRMIPLNTDFEDAGDKKASEKEIDLESK